MSFSPRRWQIWSVALEVAMIRGSSPPFEVCPLPLPLSPLVLVHAGCQGQGHGTGQTGAEQFFPKLSHFRFLFAP